MMIEDPHESMDGYRIRWLSDESLAFIDEQLRDRLIHGIGVNPYRGWRRPLGELSEMRCSVEALAIPYGDRVEGVDGFLRSHRNLELLLLSEFSGNIEIRGESIRVLRVRLTKRMVFGDFPNLSLLAIRKGNKDTLVHLCPKAPRCEALEINDLPIVDLDGIQACKRLRRLQIVNMKRLRSLEQLEALPDLEDLTLECTKGIQGLGSTLRCLRKLKRLRLLDCSVLDDFEFVNALELQEFRCVGTEVLRKNRSLLKEIPVSFVE